MKKRFLASLLALVMALCLLPAAALAAEDVPEGFAAVPADRLEPVVVQGVEATPADGAVTYTVNSKEITTDWDQDSGEGSDQATTYAGVYITMPEGATWLQTSDNGSTAEEDLWTGEPDSAFLSGGRYQQWVPVAVYDETNGVFSLPRGGQEYTILLIWYNGEGSKDENSEEVAREYVKITRDLSDELAVAQVGDYTYETLSDAVEAATAENNTITLLQNITTLEQIDVVTAAPTILTIDKNVTIVGNGHSIDITIPDSFGEEDQAIRVESGAELTLDGVTLTVKGKTNGHGDAFDMYGTLKIINGSNVALNNLRSAFTMQGGVKAVVNVNGSIVTANTINGNFSNGGQFTFTNSNVDISDCTSYGISANKITVDNSVVDITGVELAAIKTVDDNAELNLTNDSAVTVTNSGSRLPFGSNFGVAKGVVDLGHGSERGSEGDGTDIDDQAAALNVESGSSINLSGNVDKNSEDVNFVYMTDTATLSNEGTVTAVETEEATGNNYRINYMVNDQLYTTITATAAENEGVTTVTYAEPEDPVVTGYTFNGWIYGENVAVADDGTVTITVAAEDDNTYEFAASMANNSSYIPGTGTPTGNVTVSATTNGSVTVTPTNPAVGATVTVTVAPNSGYVLNTLSVTDASGNAVALTRLSDTQYTFTMPQGRVTVNATFVAEVSELPFTDVGVSDWYYEAVKYAYDNGLMDGVGGNLFDPNGTLTRGMMVTVLYRLESEPTVTGGSEFTDVAEGQWYADAVTWAAANGIVNGISETEFAPSMEITREQLATMIYRYAAYKGYDVTAGGMALQEYTDYEDISEYAVNALAWAVSEGLVNGMGDNTLQPVGTATRAQTATILMRYSENVAQ